jgi:signal transduction histidine kinase
LIEVSLRAPRRVFERLISFSHDPLANESPLPHGAEAALPKELKELNHNLAQMAIRLKTKRAAVQELLRELESRVQIRTRELETAMVAAQAANRSKSAFLSTVSHELQTPLTSIITGIGILRAGPAPKSDLENRTLRTLEKSTLVLHELISGVLDYTRIGAGAVNLKNKTFAPADCLADVAIIMDPLAKQSGLSLETEAQYPADLKWTGDQARVEQVLMNLVGNAVKFTAAGHVKISSAVLEANPGAPRRLSFTVQDSGPGIPAENLQTIFEPFEQLASMRIKSQSGTGLGLSISRKLVEMMGERFPSRAERAKAPPSRSGCRRRPARSPDRIRPDGSLHLASGSARRTVRPGSGVRAATSNAPPLRRA